MNAHTFDSHYPSCPICQRPLAIKHRGLDSGLYICSYCQQRLVVSTSGHYVRDPFAIVGVKSGRLLRRQSRPIARMMRDLAVSPTLYVVASVVLLSFTLVAVFRVPENPVPRLLEGVRKFHESIKE